jgi:transposase
MDRLGQAVPTPGLRRGATPHRRNRAAIDAALDSGLSNALIKSTNTKIRLLARIAFGFHGPEPLIARAMLALGGHPPKLPGRRRPTD